MYAILAVPMQLDELKSLVEQLGKLVDARAKTTETVIKAEIKASEARTTKRIDEAKEELRAELAIAIHQVDTNLVKKVNNQERRLEALEEKTETPNPNKH